MVDNKSFSDTDSGSFDEGGNYSDWGSKEEYDDDFGADSTWGDDGGDSGGSSGGGGGGGSYIATAATQALGEEGLTVFEDWRDYMYKVVPEFTVSFGRYRVTAPKIVAEIDTKEDSKRIYKDIWDKHLKPIYDLIVADRDSVKAQDDYRIMVRELMNKYLKGFLAMVGAVLAWSSLEVTGSYIFAEGAGTVTLLSTRFLFATLMFGGTILFQKFYRHLLLRLWPV